MISIYGHHSVDLQPAVITYDHFEDQVTIGYWTHGKLTEVTSHRGCTSDALLHIPDSKHLTLSNSGDAQVISKGDFDESKREQYAKNMHSNLLRVNSVELNASNQALVYSSRLPSQMLNGLKCQRHYIEGMALASVKREVVFLVNYGGRATIAYANNQTIIAHQSIDQSIDLMYQVLAFYQTNTIDPIMPLCHSGYPGSAINALIDYLPAISEMKVPSQFLSYQVADHRDIIPHYLAYLCVS